MRRVITGILLESKVLVFVHLNWNIVFILFINPRVLILLSSEAWEWLAHANTADCQCKVSEGPLELHNIQPKKRPNYYNVQWAQVIKEIA